MKIKRMCPRCNGDTRLDRDEYGWYEQCLMCGYMRDLDNLLQPHHPVADLSGEGKVKVA